VKAVLTEWVIEGQLGVDPSVFYRPNPNRNPIRGKSREDKQDGKAGEKQGKSGKPGQTSVLVSLVSPRHVKNS
jgi:hypothetical protein